MSWNLNRRSAATACLAMAALAIAAFAAPHAGAAVAGGGQATIAVAKHSKGRTLSGQGVKLLAGAGTRLDGAKLALPIASLDPSATQASATSGASLRFKKGKRAVGLTGISFDLAARTVEGRLGGREMAVFRLGAGASVDPAAGSIVLRDAALRLTADAAKALKEKLGLERALVRKGVGMAWISAQANPIQTARTVVSGSLAWGFKASWRGYVLSPPEGSVEVSDGATATGALDSAATTYGFPVGKGAFTEGIYGAASKLSVATGGSVKWAKPGHGINEVRFSDLEVELNGAESWLIGDVKAEIGPPSESKDVRIAALDASGVTPVVSGDGRTVIWSSIPATLTEEGSTSFAGFYSAGTALDPITITVGLG